MKYSKELQKEIKTIIKKFRINCLVDEFETKVSYFNFWDSISIYGKLSENFIREFKNKLNWYYISIYQTLSENFIREMQDKVSWPLLASFHKNNMSKQFILEFQNKLEQNTPKIPKSPKATKCHLKPLEEPKRMWTRKKSSKRNTSP